MDTWAWVLSGVILLTGYGLLAVRLARVYRLPEPEAERLLVELPRLGHHVALYHYPGRRRWAEPVILCHGLGSNRYNVDFFDDGEGQDRLSLARRLQDRGFDVWSLETRGHGHARVQGGRWGLFDEVRQDFVVALDTVSQMSGSRRVFWLGHSWGGLIPLVHEATQAPRLAGLIAVGTPGRIRQAPSALHPILRVLERVPIGLPLPLMARMALPMAAPLALLARVLAPRLTRLPDPMLRRLLASLPAPIPPGIMADLARFARIGGLADEEGRRVDWSEMNTPVFFVAGQRDWLAPVPSVRAAFEGVGAEDKTFLLARNEGQGASDFGHGGLLLGEHAPEVVFPAIEHWLEARAHPHAEPRANGVAHPIG
ncbi:MAG: alpha/beta fold hydrolase [Myxococcota bacterium]